MAATSYVKQSYTALGATPQALVAPMDCDYFVVRNRGAVQLTMLTDLTDPVQYDVLDPGNQDQITNMIARTSSEEAATGIGIAVRHRFRFPAGTTVFWLKAVSGTGMASVTWVA